MTAIFIYKHQGMKKLISIFGVFVTLFFTKAQIISSSKWSDLFSYNNVLAIKEDNGKLIAATENGIFYYTIATGEITKLSKANGLHEVKISAFDYNPETHIGLVGYTNGSMDIITPDAITFVVDIPIANGFTGDKKINHISINGNKAVISVSYGVSIFDLEKKEFGDTCFFMSGSNFTAARESVIRENTVYTATANGIVSHELDVTFPVFSGWTTIWGGNAMQISNGEILIFSTSNAVRYLTGTGVAAFPGSYTSIKDIIANGSEILIADQNTVKLYNTSGTLLKQNDFAETTNTGIYTGNQLFAGTKLSGIKNEAGNEIKPDGPFNNSSYKMDMYQNQIVISSGGRNAFNNPIYRNLGYYHFDGTKWNYPDYFLTNTSGMNVLDAVINRSKPSEIFFTNYSLIAGKRGIYKMQDNQFVKQYEGSYTGVNNLPGGLTYDENKQLFASVMFIGSTPYKIGYYYYNAASDAFVLNSVVIAGGVQKPFTKDGILYIPAPFVGDGGLLLYDYNNSPSSTGDDRFKIIRTDNNLPKNGVVSAAVDKSDNVWIGTQGGLRILSNPKSAISEDNPQTEPVIIEENGLGEELFRDNSVLQIAVDTGNQKWVSVDGGGVFYLNSTGEQTFQHFTKANSPLPTNSVTDIKIDEISGKVYFVTLDGVVVYQGDVVDVNENFGDVLVYPNPVVYANYKGNVTIRGLAEKTNIRITDAAGNLVHQAVARGGFYEWNLNNQRGIRVASGIYFVLMTNEDGTDTATAKIAVVN